MKNINLVEKILLFFFKSLCVYKNKAGFVGLFFLIGFSPTPKELKNLPTNFPIKS